jgi:membrane-associated phospholipid phosphatase
MFFLNFAIVLSIATTQVIYEFVVPGKKRHNQKPESKKLVEVNNTHKAVLSRVHEIPGKELKIWCQWLLLIGVVFLVFYPIAGRLASLSNHVFKLYSASELNTAFVPAFIWVYLSTFLLIILPPLFLSVPAIEILGKTILSATVFSVIIYLCLPGKLGFKRRTPVNPVYNAIFSWLFSVDLPFNQMPSLHVVYSSLIMLAIIGNARTLLLRSFCWLWLTLICLSTLLVHQHQLIDVITGLLVAWLFHISI